MGRWKKFKASLILCYKSRDTGFTASDNWPINGLRSPESAGVTSPRIDNQLPTVTSSSRMWLCQKTSSKYSWQRGTQTHGGEHYLGNNATGWQLSWGNWKLLSSCNKTRVDSVKFCPMRARESFHFNQWQPSVLRPDYSVFVSHEGLAPNVTIIRVLSLCVSAPGQCLKALCIDRSHDSQQSESV